MSIELTTAGKARAIAAIQAVHAEYVAKDGLRAAEHTYTARREGTAAHIYRLAKWATQQVAPVSAAADLFCALCRHAETEYKVAAGLTADKYLHELRIWRVFKSQIKSAMSLGLSPLEHRTMHQLKKAAQIKQGKRGKRVEITEHVVSHWFARAKVDKSLGDALQELVISAASAEKPQRAAAVVRRALREVSALQGKSELRAVA
jgi:hypothetical protein